MKCEGFVMGSLNRTSFESSETAILDRLLESVSGAMTPEAARYFLNVKFPPADIAKMKELAVKSREGSLSEKERLELENYCHVGDLLGILHSKARMILRK